MVNLDRAKAPGLKSQKGGYIGINIAPFLRLQPRELSRGSKFTILNRAGYKSAKNRLSKRGLYWLDTNPFATIDFWQLSIPPSGQLLNELVYKGF